MNIINNLLVRGIIEVEDDYYVWTSENYIMTYTVEGLLYIVDRMVEIDDDVELYDENDVMGYLTDGYSFFKRDVI
jgi:hypothetical protein